MKKIIALFVSLMLLVPIVYGQTKKLQSKKSQTTKTTKKKPAQAKSSASSAPVKKKIRLFEGTLLYASYECHSKPVRSASFGMAYNGERNTRVTVRRDRIKISDETTHVHTLICPGSKELVMYSDLTNEGVSLDYKTGIPLYIDKYSLDNKYFNLNYQNKGSIVYGGDKCIKVSSQLISKTSHDYANSSGYIEYWESDAFSVSSVYAFVFYGAPVKGIVKKWIMMNDMSFFLASFRSIVASELVAINEHKVSDGELVCPSNVTIKQNATNSDLIKFYKANNKAMKKKKIKPRNADSKEIVNTINQDWPFVFDWNNNLRQQNHQAWSNFGDALLTSAANKIESTVSKSQETQAEQVEQTGIAHNSGISGDKSGMIVCESCHGSLVCSKCHGTGKKNIVYGTTSRKGKVSVKRGTEKCPICFGKKVCPICKGVGYYKSPYTDYSSENQATESLSDDDSDIENLDEDKKQKEAEKYARRYDEYESLAMKAYNNLTSSSGYKGYSSKDKKTGKEKGHFSSTSDGDTSIMKGVNFVSQNKQLRSYQNQMRIARRKAYKLGLKIEKSEYEDIKVTYK